MRAHRRRTVLSTASAVALLALGACGPTAAPDSSRVAGLSASPTPEFDTRHNEHDVDFATSMIERHRQAVEMASIADERKASPAVQKIALQIEEAQGGEILLLTELLGLWGKAAALPQEHDHDATTKRGVIAIERMDDLNGSTGTAFDKLFLQLMIEHHQGAIAIAKAHDGEGLNSDANGVALLIVSEQTKEVEAMKRLLKTT